MKLIIYSHSFAPQVGGVETFSAYLASGLAAFDSRETPDSLAVTVITNTPEIDKRATDLPFRVVRRPSLRTLWQLIGAVDKVLLAGPAILPMLFALVRRRPVIVTHHGYQSICPNGMLFQFSKRRICPGHFAAKRYMECVKCNSAQVKFWGSVRLLLVTFLRRLLSRLADLNVAVSEHVRWRIALPETQVIRNGVPESVPICGAPDTHSSQPCCFAYLGRLITEKGLPVLVEAAGILKRRGRRFRILLIGDGPEREPLQAQISSLDLDQEMVLLGFLKGSQLEEAMSSVSALVMPSICEDAAPFSVLEQMMRGRLVIGSKVGGLAEEIGDSGLIFAAGDPIGLAEEMERVIARPGLIAALGNKARERALRIYTLQRMVAEYRSAVNLLNPRLRLARALRRT